MRGDQRETPGRRPPWLGGREGSWPSEQGVVCPPARRQQGLTLPARCCPRSPQPAHLEDAQLARSTRGGRVPGERLAGHGWPWSCHAPGEASPPPRHSPGSVRTRRGPNALWPRGEVVCPRPRGGRGTKPAAGPQRQDRSQRGRARAAERPDIAPGAAGLSRAEQGTAGIQRQGTTPGSFWGRRGDRTGAGGPGGCWRSQGGRLGVGLGQSRAGGQGRDEMGLGWSQGRAGMEPGIDGAGTGARRGLGQSCEGGGQDRAGMEAGMGVGGSRDGAGMEPGGSRDGAGMEPGGSREGVGTQQG